MSAILEKYRYSLILLKQLIKTDFKLRYQGSILGYTWSLLKPLALFTILYVVFVRFLRFDSAVPHYASYLLLGIVLWSFFTEVANGGLGSIVGRGDLLRKLNFPRYVIVLSTAFSALINLAINMVVVFIFMVIQGVDLRLSMLWFPLIVLELFILSLSIAFLLSALFVRFRDISHIWEVILQGLFYATPIIYPLSMVADKYAKILLLNPVAQLIQDARFAIISDKTKTLAHLSAPSWYIIPLLITGLTAIFSLAYFRSRSRYFAEEV